MYTTYGIKYSIVSNEQMHFKGNISSLYDYSNDAIFSPP